MDRDDGVGALGEEPLVDLLELARGWRPRLGPRCARGGHPLPELGRREVLAGAERLVPERVTDKGDDRDAVRLGLGRIQVRGRDRSRRRHGPQLPSSRPPALPAADDTGPCASAERPSGRAWTEAPKDCRERPGRSPLRQWRPARVGFQALRRPGGASIRWGGRSCPGRLHHRPGPLVRLRRPRLLVGAPRSGDWITSAWSSRRRPGVPTRCREPFRRRRRLSSQSLPRQAPSSPALLPWTSIAQRTRRARYKSPAAWLLSDVR